MRTPDEVGEEMRATPSTLHRMAALVPFIVHTTKVMWGVGNGTPDELAANPPAYRLAMIVGIDGEGNDGGLLVGFDEHGLPPSDDADHELARRVDLLASAIKSTLRGSGMLTSEVFAALAASAAAEEQKGDAARVRPLPRRPRTGPGRRRG